jgi:NADPH-dependent curcumin reductase CurA
VTEELGFDACIDHRLPDFAARLATACPKGIDVYFENVGGAVFEAVFPLLNPFARIPVCGLISMYNATSLSPGPILLPHLMRATLTKRLTFRGFIVSDFFGRYGDFMHDVSAWFGEGRIKYREDVVDGLENAPLPVRRDQNATQTDSYGPAKVFSWPSTGSIICPAA